MTEKQIGGGLRELPKDDRDISMGAVFGTPKKIPEVDFVVANPLTIKDQGTSDLCTAYALTAVSEDQEGVELSPEYQFAKTKQLMGEYESWGADLRSACKSAVKFGSITHLRDYFKYFPQEYYPSNSYPAIFADKGWSSHDQMPRDFLANWGNWPSELDNYAKAHQKAAFLSVDGSYDTFDNIRATLWAYKDEKRSIVTGALWRQGWTVAPQGVIWDSIEKGQFGHAFKIFGQKYINTKPYLVAQLSNGEGIGNRGIFYLPRRVVNQEFTFGSFMFKDLPPKMTKEQASDRSMLYRKGIVGRITIFLQDYFHAIIK